MNGEVLLDIVDESSMLIHHKITWIIHNISDHDLNGCEFGAGSIVQRKLVDIHFKAFDQNDNEIKNVRPVIDQPYHKAFVIPFDRRILPNEDVKVVMEYDWEEPDREFVYNFQIPYDQFRIILSHPKGLPVNTGVHKTGFSGSILEADVHLKQPFTIKDNGNRIRLEWQQDNIMPPMGYRLRW